MADLEFILELILLEQQAISRLHFALPEPLLITADIHKPSPQIAD